MTANATEQVDGPLVRIGPQTDGLGQILEPGSRVVLANTSGERVRLRVDVAHLGRPAPERVQYVLRAPDWGHFVGNRPIRESCVYGETGVGHARKFATAAEAVAFGLGLAEIDHRLRRLKVVPVGAGLGLGDALGSIEELDGPAG